MTILYHYTTAMGLKGILDSKSLWASDYRFLNDTSEFWYGWNLVKDEVYRCEKKIGTASPFALDMLKERLPLMAHSEVVALVASLSTEGDLLSQWRGYNGGKGFAIGFNSDWLLRNANRQNFHMLPVVYDQESQRTAVYNAVHLLVDLLKETDGEPKSVSDVVSRWWEHALKVALALKDQHFEEESEQRLAYVGKDWPSGIQVRNGPAGLVPYLPCCLDRVTINDLLFEPKNLGLEEIIIGPALRESQKFAVDALLASHHMRFCVRKSAIPYMAD